MPGGRNRCSDRLNKVCKKPQGRGEGGRAMQRKCVSQLLLCDKLPEMPQLATMHVGFLKVSVGQDPGVVKPRPLLRGSGGCRHGVTSLYPRPGGPLGKGPLPSSCCRNAFPCHCRPEVPIIFLAVDQGLLSAPGGLPLTGPLTTGQRLTKPTGRTRLLSAGTES